MITEYFYFMTTFPWASSSRLYTFSAAASQQLAFFTKRRKQLDNFPSRSVLHALCYRILVRLDCLYGTCLDEYIQSIHLFVSQKRIVMNFPCVYVYAA